RTRRRFAEHSNTEVIGRSGKCPVKAEESLEQMSETKIDMTANSPEQRELRYEPQRIEEKWHARWESNPTLYAAEPHDSKRKKYYVLEMLPYPSGALHMGHVRNYAI